MKVGRRMAIDTVQIDLPKPRYTLVACKREGLREVISINAALVAFPHTKIFPWHVRVRMFFTDMAANGMPTSAESELLFSIADKIEQTMLEVRTQLNCSNAQFLARSTWNELRELHFRVHDPELADAALKALLSSREWERAWEYRIDHDPEWEEAAYIFKVLAPKKPN